MGFSNLFKQKKKETDYSSYSQEARKEFESQIRQKELDAQLKVKEEELAKNPPIQTQYVSFSPKIQNRREQNIAKRKERLEILHKKKEDWKIKEELRKIRQNIELEKMNAKKLNVIKPFRISSHPIY
jgi:hypothetical protein